jgi:hypothetical protein
MAGKVFIRLKMLTAYKYPHMTEYVGVNFILSIEQIEAVYCADNIHTEYSGHVAEIRTTSGGVYPVVGTVAEIEEQLMEAFSHWNA